MNNLFICSQITIVLVTLVLWFWSNYLSWFIVVFLWENQLFTSNLDKYYSDSALSNQMICWHQTRPYEHQWRRRLRSPKKGKTGKHKQWPQNLFGEPYIEYIRCQTNGSAFAYNNVPMILRTVLTRMDFLCRYVTIDP